ncbi:hypothetical protein BAUCODRAFT_70509 [Baudoinia panamericana UAMH 10762]|uniref:Amidohydrolase-related domain-containing protein n=1 Tax=Baudoinia panamericana (strain UAMH 10762) TaxID=717646 RepID=M2LPH3_BAUPA|nr:uncharacterized protein BAUCODRAFT_70509 [Baudoinia panamericana UAMH 10762]EMC96292.1 hypothetical protein BAUCODRAFT_70509 [Baudoinia panamericana UAMH 10762]
MHIIDPDRYPLAPGAAYVPPVHNIWDAVANETTFGMKHIVIVQPSIYGYDNTALLESLRALGPTRARAVVQFQPSINRTTLQAWHQLGVRGVRLNLQSTDQTVNATAFAATLRQYADIIRPLGWVLQAYISMDLIGALESTIRDLGVPFCVDHFGQPSASPVNSSAKNFDPYTIPGFPATIRLLQGGHMWVKFSANYRVNLTAHGLETVGKEILRVRSDRVVWATDWPHTRFEGVDIRPFEEEVLEWCEEIDAVEQVFSTNAKCLWGIYSSAQGCQIV